MWVGLIQSAEGLRERTAIPKEEGFLLQTAFVSNCNFPVPLQSHEPIP